MTSMFTALFSRDPVKEFPFDLLNKYPDVEQFSVFSLYSGKSRTTQEDVSIFCANLKDLGYLLAQKAAACLKKIKTLRHPSILLYLDSIQTDTLIYIVTEAVVPFTSYVRNLKEFSNFKEVASWGLYSVANAVSFLSQDVKCVHNNINCHSIYVNKSGEWKLFGFEYLISYEDEPEALQKPGEFEQYAAPEVRDGRVVLKNNWTVDAYVFNGPLSDASLLKNPNSIPKEIQKDVRLLLHPAISSRLSVGDFVRRNRVTGGFFTNPVVDNLLFLEEFHLKDSNEQCAMLNSLSNILDQFPKDIQVHKILSRINEMIKFSNVGCSAIPALIKIGKLLGEEEYQIHVIPSVVAMFASQDRITRVRLLEQLEHFIDHLKPDVVNEKIFPPLVTGLLDTSASIREHTMKASVQIAPKLNYKNLNENLTRHFLRILIKDEQPGIRTNCCIALGKIAPYLQPEVRQKILIPSFCRSMKDPFPPARIAGILALSATEQFYPLKSVAVAILPSLTVLMIDPEKQVRENAFRSCKGFMEKLEKASENPEIIPKLESEVNMRYSAGSLAQNMPQWASRALSSLTTKFQKPVSSLLARSDLKEEAASTKKHQAEDFTPSSDGKNPTVTTPTTTNSTVVANSTFTAASSSTVVKSESELLDKFKSDWNSWDDDWDSEQTPAKQQTATTDLNDDDKFSMQTEVNDVNEEIDWATGEDWQGWDELLSSPAVVAKSIVQFLLTYADEASVLKKLEDMGVRVGLALAEFLSMDMLPLRAEIDVVKFLCKEFWCGIFGKQVNSLRTNHQGIYVIYDNSFVLLQPFSNNNQYQEEVQRYLAFTRGLIRGVLGDFGLNAAVVADVQEMPALPADGVVFATSAVETNWLLLLLLLCFFCSFGNLETSLLVCFSSGLDCQHLQMDDGTSGAESQILMSSTNVEESHDNAQIDNVNSGQSVEMPQPAPRKNSKKSVVEEEEEEEEEEEDEDDEEFLSRRSKPALKIIVHNEPSAAAVPPVQSNTTLEMTAKTTKQEWSWNSSIQDSSNIIDEAKLKSECPDAPVAVKSDDSIEKKVLENVENFTKEMPKADSAEAEKAGTVQTVEEIGNNQKIIAQRNSTNNATENTSSNENDAASTVVKSEPEIGKQEDKIQDIVENETAVVKSESESGKSEMEKQFIEIHTTQESANAVASAEPVSAAVMVESETKQQVDQIQSDSAVSQQQNEAKLQAEEENAKSVVHIQTVQQQVSAVEKSDDCKAEEQLANGQQQRVVVTSTDLGTTEQQFAPVGSQEEKAETPSNVEHVTGADIENVAKDVEKLGTSQSAAVVQTTVISSENEPSDKQNLHSTTSAVAQSKHTDNSTVTRSKIEISPIEVSSVKPIHDSSTGSKLKTEQSESNTCETSTKQQQHSADNLEADHQIGSAVTFESTVEDGYRKEVKTETKVSKSPNSSTTTKIISTTVKMEKQGTEAVPNMKDFIHAEMADLMKKMEQQHGSGVVFKDVQLMDKQSSTTGKTEQRFESTAQKAADQANADFSKPTSKTTFQSTEIPIERLLVDSDAQHQQPTAQKTVTRIEKTRTYMKKVDDPTSWIQQESVAKNNWASSAPWAKSTSTIAVPFSIPDVGKAQHYYKQVKTTTTTTTRTERSSTTAGAEPKTTVTSSETVSQEGSKPSFDSWFGTVFVKPDTIRPLTVVEHQTADKSYSTNNAKAGASSFAEDVVSTTVPANVYSTHYSQSVVEIPLQQQHHSAEPTNNSRYTSNYSTKQTRSYQTSRPLSGQASGQQQQQQYQTFTEVPFSSHDQFVDRSWMGQQVKIPFAENANQSYSKTTYHSSERSILKQQPALSTQWQQHATAYGNQLTGQPAAASQSKLFLGKMPGRMTTKWPPSNFTVNNEQEQHFHSSENGGMRRTSWHEDVGHAPPAGQQQREEVGQQRQAPSTTGGSFWTVTTTRHHTSTAR
ncbi:N-terminal kinase-like protein [Trichinella pseudospiralis]|uniref:N-terminal kinase-like protein n=1 Tax=Trichinella pseudospiralis TaxID=6337 RepID=A0A0V0XGF6_TRIPS|nr:N-terminal kinase-like protein [Trichinella pseudospiralis]